MQSFIWTPERIAELRRLAGEGLSTSQIALAMSADLGHGETLTRNSIIGKMHRHGIASRVPPPVPAKPKPASSPRPVTLAKTTPKPPPLLSPLGALVPRRPDVPIHAVGVPLLDLGAGMCRAPLWGNERPTIEAALHCGAPTAPGDCYCGGHARRFYVPVMVRPRAPLRRAAA
jgi:hypothetical protein